MTKTKNVTVLGLGPMGSRMAEVYLEQGYRVTVWNRTASKADPLVAKGAQRAGSATEAVRAADLIVISQVDYQSMYDSLGTTLDLTGKVLVNLSSDTPNTLRAAAEWVAERGGELITGGIMVPPPGIGTPMAYTFYSGPESLIERHREALQVLGGVQIMGADHGLAMAYYTAAYYLFTANLAAFVQAAAMVGDARKLLPFAQELVRELGGVGPLGIGEFAEDIATAAYSGADNSLHMMKVSMEHVVQAGKEMGLDTSVPGALTALMDKADKAGHPSMSSLYEVVRKP